MTMQDIFYGIDFGTTNSAVYAIDVSNRTEYNVEYAIGEDDKRPLPSYVAVDRKSGKVLTGLDAKNGIISQDNYEIFSSIKSIIGADKEWIIAEKKWTPVDIAAELFKALKEKAEKKTKQKLTEAVIAVPVGFSSVKKNNIRRAAEKAGIKVAMFVSEPTAAFCGRKDEMRKYRNIVVFDWGGGTLDVVVLRIENGIISELASNGISVAGNDIDRKLAYRLCMNASRKNGMDFNFEDLSEPVKNRLHIKCEEAKCNLADEDIAAVYESELDNFGMLMEKVSYDYFELLVEEEITQALNCMLATISEAGLNRDSIDCILCEGGSSRLRPLHTRLQMYFKKEQLVFPKKAMWDIASGAAQIAMSPGCYMLNKPIGVIQSNNVFYPLLKVGQRIPTEEKTVRFGIVESTEEARIILTDGENENSQTFLEVFSVRLRGFSDEVIDVSCYVDADLVFKLKVHSNRMPEDVFRVWTYSNLKLSYEIDAPRPIIGDKNN